MCVWGGATFFIFIGHRDLHWSFNLSLSLSFDVVFWNPVTDEDTEQSAFRMCSTWNMSFIFHTEQIRILPNTWQPYIGHTRHTVGNLGQALKGTRF